MRHLPGDWSGLVVFCAGTAWSGNRGSDQHLAERLGRHAPVLYVEPPLWERDATTGRESLRLVGPALAVVTPRGLRGDAKPGVHVLNDRMIRQSIRSAVRTLGGPVAVIIVASLQNLFGAAPAARHIFYGTDDFVAGAGLMGISASRLRRQEEHQLSRADCVVAVSAHLAQHWEGRARDLVLVPNGVDDAHFAAADTAALPSDVALAPPVAGFVGHLNERIDVSLLEDVAEREHSLLVVGPRSRMLDNDRMERLFARPNVRWVGPKAFDSLPSYLRLIDVGLVPYVDSAFNRASFPLKTLEYLAAGRAVVATELPSIRWLDTDLVDVATERDFAAAVDVASKRHRTASLVARRRAFAHQHGWDVRAEEFFAVLGLGRDGPGSVSHRGAFPPHSYTAPVANPVARPRNDG